MKLKINDTVVLKDSDGLCDKPQEKRKQYLGIHVTIKEIFPERQNGESDENYVYRKEQQDSFSFKEISTFFIHEDGGHFEWCPEDIKL